MSGSASASGFQTPGSVNTAALQAEFQAAANSVLATGAPKDYKKRVALLMHFEQDDIGCDLLEDELAMTFKDFYQIETKQIKFLKNEEPQFKLNAELLKLCDLGYSKKDCLIILVYSGHGQSVPEDPPSAFKGASHTLILHGAYNKKYPHLPLTKPVDWVATTNFLGAQDCDVLHILDCCYAVEGLRAKATILAAGTETVNSDSDTCFTKALIEELKRMSSTSFTIASLYEEIRRNRTKHRLAYMPFYHKHPSTSTIVLRNQSIKTKPKVLETPGPGPRILLTAHVDKTLGQDGITEIKDWLSTLLPSVVKGLDIKLEGHWDSTSSLLLFSLPISIWAELNPYCDAFSYVGEVTSGNKLIAPSAQPGVLAIRPAPGYENKKPGQSSGQK